MRGSGWSWNPSIEHTWEGLRALRGGASFCGVSCWSWQTKPTFQTNTCEMRWATSTTNVSFHHGGDADEFINALELNTHIFGCFNSSGDQQSNKGLSVNKCAFCTCQSGLFDAHRINAEVKSRRSLLTCCAVMQVSSCAREWFIVACCFISVTFKAFRMDDKHSSNGTVIRNVRF